MNQNEQNQCEIVIEIPYAEISLVSLKNQELQYIDKDKLKICEFSNTKTHIFLMNNFRLVIFKQIPIYVTEFDEFRTYVVYNDEKNYCIKISKQYEKLYPSFEQILSEICTLIYNSENYIDKCNAEVVNETNQNELDDNEKNQKINEIQSKNCQKVQENNIVKFIKSGGKVITQGIQYGTKATTKVIKTSADYLLPNKGFQKKNIQISQKTKNKVKKIQKQSGEVFQLTSQTVKAILDIQSTLTQQAFEKICKNKSGTSKKLQNPKLIYIKQIAAQSLASISEILQQLDDSTGVLVKEFGQNYRKVIKERYGDDLAELTDIFFETSENIQKIYIGVTNTGTKGLLKQQGKITAVEVGKKL
ncbi:hypothetical protein PPERSA_09050 [Pseudocohnilembus persalinus]|uniref:Senescence domain-containing protein n=1 Tax=Pseudocohnilembus persalinus TaxID=266149 RepID=A0A0V0QLR2_PSEPJ|nr:hypothetical protein PPERSA_09050 [Pseudocohnilembus persalinus]|eukprot:KRX02928.1 hypothetical protein PPERSA_09050 [Pseudocohnilembus persalinus]